MPKLVSLSPEAYGRLKARKIGVESFSDTVLRITGKARLSDFAGILTEKEAAGLDKKIKELRASSRIRTEKIRKELK